jgi:hypothetical protein
MRKRLVIIAAMATAVIGAGIAYASSQVQQSDPTRQATEFYKGHWHDEHGNANGAPAHSGGLDRNGCHNASVPYHCH